MVGEASSSFFQLSFIHCECIYCRTINQLVRSVQYFKFCSRQLLLATLTRDERALRGWFHTPPSLNEQVFRARWGMKKVNEVN